jgi:hypothetical protein
VVTAYNPGGRAAADVDNRTAARALVADPRLDGLMLLPSFGGHPDGAWLEPGVAVIGLSRHQARALGRAHGQLAVYELQELDPLSQRHRRGAAARARPVSRRPGNGPLG